MMHLVMSLYKDKIFIVFSVCLRYANVSEIYGFQATFSRLWRWKCYGVESWNQQNISGENDSLRTRLVFIIQEVLQN